MALIDKASLLMVPSTYEAGKLYNVLPSGNRAPDSTDQNSGYDQTRADFDFDRGSNAAATRVNAAGLIEKYRENLLLQSNNFDTTWIKNNGSSFASGKEGYDKTNNAWQFNVATTTNSAAYQQFSFSGVGTFSAYFKKGTIDKVAFANFAGSAYECWFDLTNGTIGQQTGDLIDAKIEAVGTDGWYRCSITDLNNGNSYFQLKPSNAFSTASTAGHIFIQNAQLESSLVATDVLTSGATTAKSGVLVDLPRINYDANGNNGALLLEPQRANLITHSEYIGASYWTKSNLSITTNNAISPSGFLDSSLITLSAGANIKQFYSGSFSAISTNYAYSGFFKKGTHNFIQLLAGSTDIVNFDLTLGTYNSPSSTLADIEDYENGWFRCTMLASGASSSITIINVLPVDSLSSIRAASTSSTGNFYAWGLQIESGATYPTSYIPTMGTAQTRAADSCSVTGASDVIGQTEGTVYYDWIMNHESPNTGEDLYSLVLSNGTNNNLLGINNYNNFLAVFIKNTTTQFYSSAYTGGADGARIKLALAYKVNDFALYINGTQIATDASGSVPALNQINLNSFWNGQLRDDTSVKQLALFKERLTNAELATLTTL